MSALAEEAHERWMNAHVAELERAFKPGMRVFRAGWEDVEEGVATRVAKGSWRSNGDFLENIKLGPYDAHLGREQDGTASYFWARFGSEHVGQGYEWRWFRDERAALADLVRQLERRADEKRHELEKLEARRAKHMTALVADWPATGMDALAIKLAASDTDGLRYFKGGWYSVPAILGVQEAPAVEGAAVREPVVKHCVDAGWLKRVSTDASDLRGGMAALYAVRWTATDNGRVAARIGTKEL